MPDSETVPCPLCRGEVSPDAMKCRHCGEWIARSCRDCGTPLRGEWAARGSCAECSASRRAQPVAQTGAAPARYPPKNRGVAALLALLGGGLGLHKFYLGQVGLGLIYLLLFWTFIPAIVGFFEGIGYALMSEE